MNKPVSRKRPSAAADYKVGYKKPPVASRFGSGVSGNPTGARKRPKRRSMTRAIQDVFTREITVRDGKRRRKVSSIVALIQKALIDAMNGDKQATRFCYRTAEQFGVFKIQDRVDIDFSSLTPEERDICQKGMLILNRAGMLSRYENR